MGYSRELTAVELLEVAGGFTAAAAQTSAGIIAAGQGKTDAGEIDPTDGDWTWESNGDDNGEGGYAIYFSSSLDAWGWGIDTQSPNNS